LNAIEVATLMGIMSGRHKSLRPPVTAASAAGPRSTSSPSYVGSQC